MCSNPSLLVPYTILEPPSLDPQVNQKKRPLQRHSLGLSFPEMECRVSLACHSLQGTMLSARDSLQSRCAMEVQPWWWWWNVDLDLWDWKQGCMVARAPKRIEVTQPLRPKVIHPTAAQSSQISSCPAPVGVGIDVPVPHVAWLPPETVSMHSRTRWNQWSHWLERSVLKMSRAHLCSLRFLRFLRSLFLLHSGACSLRRPQSLAVPWEVWSEAAVERWNGWDAMPRLPDPSQGRQRPGRQPWLCVHLCSEGVV